MKAETFDGPDLFTAQSAEIFKLSAGRAYRPSNGTEGMMFQELWCENCTKDALNPDTGEGGCPIIADTFVYGVDHPEYPKAWTISERGQPVCSEFTPRAAITPTPDTGTAEVALSNGEHSRGGE